MTTKEKYISKLAGKNVPNERRFLMRQLQLVAHGEPSDVIELNAVSEPALGQEKVLISMEAADATFRTEDIQRAFSEELEQWEL